MQVCSRDRFQVDAKALSSATENEKIEPEGNNMCRGVERADETCKDTGRMSCPRGCRHPWQIFRHPLQNRHLFSCYSMISEQHFNLKEEQYRDTSHNRYTTDFAIGIRASGAVVCITWAPSHGMTVTIARSNSFNTIRTCRMQKIAA
jgi:hypothetical protein